MAVIKQWMIYGAYGYTGRLIVEEAVRRGHQPILAGRDENKLLDMAAEFGLTCRLFDLSHRQKIRQAIEDLGLVLNCAGPFARTAAPIRQACLDCSVHYLDITGEIEVLEASYSCYEQARESGTVIISGVGFDVVPTDVLALLLKQAMPDATHLELAFAGSGGGISPGTAKTMLLMMPRQGKIRQDGEIVSVPLAWHSRMIDFIDKPRLCMTIPWGDIATAFYSTDIGNIRVYTAVEPGQLKWMRRLRFLSPLLSWSKLSAWLEKQIDKKVQGPNETERAQSVMYLTGMVNNADKHVTMMMQTPEGYSYTVLTALLAVEELLAHKVMPGAYTPAQALPLDAITGMEGVVVKTIENRE